MSFSPAGTPTVLPERPAPRTRPPTFSVVIPCSRPEALGRCLESLALVLRPSYNARYTTVAALGRGGPPEEVLLVATRDARACAEVAARFSGRLPGLRVLEGEGLSPGAARNLAAGSAQGDWLCFLDDDVTVPPYYFETLSDKLERFPLASAVGGPNLTPPGSPLFERCVGHVLSSPLVAGAFARRCSGLPEDSWCDDRALILCNLCVRRDALLRERLGFDEELRRNEENLLLERLLRRGHRALHCPALVVHHERRGTLAGFAAQCFLSGRGRAEMTLKLPASFRVHLLAPPALLAVLLGTPLLPRALGPVAALYALATLANASLLARRHGEGPAALAWLWLLQGTAHLAYAGGLLSAALVSSRGTAARRTAVGQAALRR